MKGWERISRPLDSRVVLHPTVVDEAHEYLDFLGNILVDPDDLFSPILSGAGSCYVIEEPGCGREWEILVQEQTDIVVDTGRVDLGSRDAGGTARRGERSSCQRIDRVGQRTDSAEVPAPHRRG